jgi:RNA polymerase sigma-70 factor (ECF subfamily)
MNNIKMSASTESDAGSPPDAEDIVLVEQTLNGVKDSFEKLFTKYRQRVFAVAWRLVRDEDAALDVVQDAFVRAYEQLDHLKGEGRFFPWIRRITVNLAIDRIRHAKRTATVSLNDHRLSDGEESREDRSATIADESLESQPAAAAELSEFNTALSAALVKLSEQHRAVFMLHATEGMSYKEIADALGCNIGTVMSRLFYARKHLQELLGSHLSEG